MTYEFEVGDIDSRGGGEPAYSAEEKAYMRWRKYRDHMAGFGARVALWRGYEAEKAAMKLYPSRSPEHRRIVSRRYRIRQKAKALGITYAEAERMTPRIPSMARHGKHRDQGGRFVATRPTQPIAARVHVPRDPHMTPLQRLNAKRAASAALAPEERSPGV